MKIQINVHCTRVVFQELFRWYQLGEAENLVHSQAQIPVLDDLHVREHGLKIGTNPVRAIEICGQAAGFQSGFRNFRNLRRHSFLLWVFWRQTLVPGHGKTCDSTVLLQKYGRV